MTNFEINRLKNLQKTLEKDEFILLEHLSKYEENDNITKIFNEYSSLRVEEFFKTQDEIKTIIYALKHAKNLLNSNGIEEIDLKQLKTELTSIQNNIQNVKLKAKSELEKSENEEIILNNEIESYQQNMLEWSKPIKYFYSSDYKLHKSMSAKHTSNISKEVKDFMDFVANSGGHENGWSIDDHQLFLKIRQKYKTPEQMAENLHAFLPDISVDDILEHELWYVKYEKLKHKQKQSIHSWRKSKSAITLPKQNTTESTVSYKTETYKKEDTKKKLAVWKAEKLEKIQYQKDFELQKLLKQKELEEHRQKRNEELKKELSKWKNSKHVQAQAIKLEQELKELQDRIDRSSQANKLIKQFQIQDQFFIERMKQIQLMRNKNRIIIKSAKKAPRDPDRVLKPTKQWLSRTKKKESNTETNSNCNILQIPKLGLPPWRKSIS